MKKSSFLFILGLLVTGLFLPISSCAPEKPEEQVYMGTYPLGDIKDYLYFKPGSMWVYECDSTGELDTQIMVICDTFWTVESYIKYQEIYRVIKSKNEGSTYTDSRINGPIPYSKKNINYFFYLMRWQVGKNNKATGSDCIFYKPYDTAELRFDGKSIYKGLLLNYKVNKITFDTVRVFQCNPTQIWPRTENKFFEKLYILSIVKFYFAKSIGLIKLEVSAYNLETGKPATHCWNLVSCKIIK